MWFVSFIRCLMPTDTESLKYGRDQMSSGGGRGNCSCLHLEANVRTFDVVVTGSGLRPTRCSVIHFLRANSDIGANALMDVAMLKAGESTTIAGMKVYRIVTDAEAYASIREAIEAAL